MRLSRRKLIVVIALSFCCVVATDIFGQKCAVDAGFRGSTYSIDRYKNRLLIKTISNLDQVPAAARGKLIEHLRKKLGDKFFDRLKYDGGEWIDLEALKRESPKDFNWNAPMGAYDLKFKFSDPKKGLKYFYSTLVLNDDGSVRTDIGLPDIGAHPGKSEIISCKQAIDIAVRNGFPKDAISVDFDFDPAGDSFIWKITDKRGTTPDETPLLAIGQGTFKKIEIQANTGRVVRIYKETIVV